jgi:hypothetical protein
MDSSNSDLILTIDDFRDSIIEMKQQQGLTNEAILVQLRREGLYTSSTTLRRRLDLWGVRKKVASPITDELAERVNYYFHHTLLNDSQIAAKIRTDDDLVTTANQVKEIRLLFNWRRQPGSASNVAQTSTTQTYVATTLLDGPDQTFDQHWFTTYLCQQFDYRACQTDISAAQQRLDPAEVASHIPDLRHARQENYTTSGPNFLWCLGGYDKLTQYGIEIYAAVDAYSRKIIWFYCGNNNRTPISVLRQYLRAVKANGLCPRFIRTDKGTVTVLLADCHFLLFIEAALQEQWSDAEYQSIRIDDCGPSTRNMRIEGLWSQLQCRATAPWISFFYSLQQADLYHQHQLADRVVLLFIFMPILRYELNTFVDVHNAHPIRKQKNRANHVPGVPTDLYRSGQQQGFPASQQVLDSLESAIPDYGRWLNRW